MARLMTLFRTLRHHQPSQLIRRALGLARERLHQALPRMATPPSGPDLELMARLPLPPFPPRDLTGPNPGEITLLGQRILLGPDLDWNPSGPRLDAMTLHYMEWVEGLETEAARHWMANWIADNPPQAPTARWAAWNAYALSLRVVVWMQTWARHDWSSSAPEYTEIRRSILAQLRDLNRRLERDLGGNHLIKNLKALIWGAAFFSGDEPIRWFEKARALLSREIQEQILPDGCHFERSPAYHLQVFADLLEIRHVWPVNTPCPALDDALDRMGQVAADLAHPDGLPSQFSDGGLHMTYAPAQCLGVHQSLRGGKISPRRTFTLPEGGYAGIRNGTSFALWDFGPVGADHLPAHGHADMLALEWSLEGQRILVDIGVFAYEAGPLRSLNRGTFGHNTVSIGGTDQCELWGSFRLGRRSRPVLDSLVSSEGILDATAHHGGYRHLPGHPVHYRRLVSDGRQVEVFDRIESTQPVSAQATFLLHPDCQPVGKGMFDTPAGRVVFETEGRWELREFEWFPDFGRRRPTRILVIELGNSGMTCRTAWKPFS